MSALARRPLLTLAPKPARPTMSRAPLVLAPIPWGKPDSALGRGLCQHITDATPPIAIAFNPLNSAKVRRLLRSVGIHT